MGRNPATGEEMRLNPKAASRSVKITPLKAFKDAVITGKRAPAKKAPAKKAAVKTTTAKKAAAKSTTVKKAAAKKSTAKKTTAKKTTAKKTTAKKTTAKKTTSSPVAPFSLRRRGLARDRCAAGRRAFHAASPSNTASTSSAIPTSTTSTLATLDGSSTANTPTAASTNARSTRVLRDSTRGAGSNRARVDGRRHSTPIGTAPRTFAHAPRAAGRHAGRPAVAVKRAARPTTVAIATMIADWTTSGVVITRNDATTASASTPSAMRDAEHDPCAEEQRRRARIPEPATIHAPREQPRANVRRRARRRRPATARRRS